MNDKNQNDKWQDELFEILLDIDKVDVSAVYSHSRNYENTKNTERSPKEYSINISDIARYSLLKMDSDDDNTIEKNIELLRKCGGKLNDNDMFIQEKNNFQPISRNFAML